VALPLGIICSSSLWFCAGIKNGSKWTWSSSHSRSNEDDLVVISLGSLTCNLSLFYYSAHLCNVLYYSFISLMNIVMTL
jgi:hypothetical protein